MEILTLHQTTTRVSEIQRRRFGRKGRRLVGAIALVEVVSVAAWAADLDLTKMGDFNGPLAHGTIGGEIQDGESHPAAKPRRADPPLPLEVTLLSISPTIVSMWTRLAVDIQIRNTGKEAVLIPATRNDLEVLRSGNQDQRVLSVFLGFTHRDSKKTLGVCVGVAAGSASVPDSMIALRPNETLVMHGVGDVNDTWRPGPLDYQADTGVIGVKAIVREEFLEDTRVYMKSRSEAATTTDTEIVWRR